MDLKNYRKIGMLTLLSLTLASSFFNGVSATQEFVQHNALARQKHRVFSGLQRASGAQAGARQWQLKWFGKKKKWNANKKRLSKEKDS